MRWAIGALHDDFFVYVSLLPEFPLYAEAAFDLWSKVDFTDPPEDMQEFSYYMTCRAGRFAVRKLFLMPIVTTLVYQAEEILDEDCDPFRENFEKEARKIIIDDLRECFAGGLSLPEELENKVYEAVVRADLIHNQNSIKKDK